MRQGADRRALSQNLNAPLCERLGVMRVSVGDSDACPNAPTGECVHRDVESIAGRGTWCSEIARGIAGRPESVSRPTVIPLHVEDAGIELQMSIEQAAFRADLVAPQRVLGDPRRRFSWA